MQWLTLSKFTPLVIFLLILMAISLLVSFFSKRISALINKKYEGDFTLALKITSLIIVTVTSIIILLLTRG